MNKKNELKFDSVFIEGMPDGYLLSSDEGFTLEEAQNLLATIYPYGMPDEDDSDAVAELKAAKAAYEVAKILFPLNTKLESGVNIEEIIKKKSKKVWKRLKDSHISFDDVDGILDWLYGMKLRNPKANYLQVIIDNIEKHIIQ